MKDSAAKARNQRLSATKRLIETHGDAKPKSHPDDTPIRNEMVKMVPKKLVKVRVVSA
jgi:hypothetical protein